MTAQPVEGLTFMTPHDPTRPSDGNPPGPTSPGSGKLLPSGSRGRRRATPLWRVLRTSVTGYLMLCILSCSFQRKLQYFPDPAPVVIPSNAQGLEEFQVTAADGVILRGWYWPGKLPVDLLLFHGNAGHRGHRLEWMADLRALGPGVCMIDYRGYGGSQGSPTEKGLYLDAEAARQWLATRSRSKMIYLGESLGCGVAVDLAARSPPSAMILQSAYPSLVEVARRAYPFLPVRLLMIDRYECEEKIGRVQCPVLFIHGERDSLIAPDLGRALFERASEPKEWYEVPGAEHNDVPWVGGTEYAARIQAFLRRHLKE